MYLPWISDEGADSAGALFAKRLNAVHSVAQIWYSDLQLCTTSITQDAGRRTQVDGCTFSICNAGKWKAWSDLAEKFSHKPAQLHMQPIDGHISLLRPMEVVTIPTRLISDWKD